MTNQMTILIDDPKIIARAADALDAQVEMHFDNFIDDEDITALLEEIKALQCFDQEKANDYLLRLVEMLHLDIKRLVNS